MRKSSVKNLTVGAPMRLILGFFIPLLGGLLFQQLYNMVDTLVVGRYLGVDALAGVGSTGSINFLVLGFCIGICNGFVIPVAQKFGEGDEDGLRKFVANSLWLSAAFAVVITVCICLLCSTILRWMATPPEIFNEAYNYIFVIFLGIPVTILYNLLSGIIRSLGDSKTPIYFLILSSLLNVLFDIVSVQFLDMGVYGPAWATVLSQAISGLLCLTVMFRRYPILRLSHDNLKPSKTHLLRLLSIGVPMGLQYSITAIGTIVVQAAVNTLAASYIAAVTVGNKLNQLFTCVFDAMGTTMAVYGAQNYGAMKLERLHKGVASCGLLAVIYSMIVLPIMVFFGAQLSALFIDSTEPLAIRLEIAKYAREFLICNGAFYISLAFVNILRFMIQGLSFTRQAIFAGIFEMIARCICGFWLTELWGYTAICFANPAAWVLADMFLVPAYFHSVKVLKRRRAQRQSKAE